MERRARVYALLALVCALTVLVFRHDVRPGPGALLLGLLSVVLAAMPVRLPGFGAYSAAFGPALAVALLPEGGPLAALVVVLLGQALHVLWHKRSQLPAAIETLAGLAALAGMSLVADPYTRVGLALALYVPLAWKLPELAADEFLGEEARVWARQWEMTSLLLVATALLGVCTFLLARTGYAIWLLPAFPALHVLARLNLRSLGREERAAFERFEERSQAELQSRREDLFETGEAIRLETKERQLLQELTSRLAASPDLAGSLDIVLETVKREVPCQSVAVFLGQELTPRAFRSPFAAGLEAEVLARQGEPIVLGCWQSGQVTTGSGERLFPGERSGVALPLRGQGVLYVGRTAEGGYTREERPTLLAIAGAAGLGLQSALRFEGQHAALDLHARAHARLKVWADRLAYLLEGVRALNSGLNRQELQERMRQLLQATLPHESGAVVLLDGMLAWPTGFARPGLQELTRLVVANGKPLLVEDRAEFRGPDPGVESFMAAPIGQLGAVVLAGAFNREQLDILSLLAHQAEVAFQNATLHLELRSTQARLVQSSKLAAVGQLAAGVAHELNTPLCAALVAVEMATLEEDAAAMDAHLAQAEEAGQRCREIIHKLLYYARQADETELDSCDLNQVVRDTLELLGHQLALDGVELSTDLSSSELPVRADAKELQQVLTALLLNAREAVLESGQRKVRVVTRAFPEWAGLQVSDCGPGVPSEIREQIFDPFFTTRPVGKGAGLGLSVSRQILTGCGGTLELAEEGPGATFRVRLPLTDPCANRA